MDPWLFPWEDYYVDSEVEKNYEENFGWRTWVSSVRVAAITELSHGPKSNPRQVAASCIPEISPEGGCVSLLADSQDRAHVQG